MSWPAGQGSAMRKAERSAACRHVDGPTGVSMLMPSVSLHHGKATKQPEREVVLSGSCQPASVISHANAGTRGSRMSAMVEGSGCA